jgi:two-component system, chemotaxis family, chemotaxis protein CheY
MLKAVIIDSSAVARGLLASVLTNGSYDVCGQANTGSQGRALLVKFRPHFVCIAREQMEDDSDLLRDIRVDFPKTLIFMVSGGIDAPTLQKAVAGGVSGFIVKPFNADTVLKTIRNTVIAMVKKQRAALAGSEAEAAAPADSAAAPTVFGGRPSATPPVIKPYKFGEEPAAAPPVVKPYKFGDN